jgi:ssDNA-binding Zn-finger/Zn-ribbon topoisomerase 1
MMNTECDQCRARFFVDGFGTESVACPDCGGGLRPERDQPSGSPSDGRLRDMLDNNNKDMGGNPLQEGVWANTDNGWQNRQKRDESFASVKTAAGGHEFMIEHSPHRMIHNGNRMALSFFDAHVNGNSVMDNEGFRNLFMTHNRENTDPWTVHVHDPSHEEPVREAIENGARIMGPQTLSKTAPTTFQHIMAIQQGQGVAPPHIDAPSAHQASLDQTVDIPWWGQSDEEFITAAIHESLVPLAILPAAGAAAAGAVGRAGLMAGAGALAKKLIKPKTIKKLLTGTGKGVGKAAKGAGNAAKWHLAIQALKGMGGDSEVTMREVRTPTLQEVSHVTADATTQMSLDKIPGDTSDPEEVDQKEFNDESHDPNVENPNNDEGFGADSPAGAKASELLPDLLMAYLDEEPHDHESHFQELHHLLDQEFPDLEDEDDHSDIAEVLEELLKSHEKKQSNLPPPWSGHPAAIPNPMMPPAGNNPAAARCPNCQGTLNPDSTCPQCGFGATPPQQGTTPQQVNQATTPTVTAKVADTQGPANPDQFRVVTEALLQQGREDEIPHMFEAPWEYADLLAELQGKANEAPEAVEAPAPPPPPPMPPGMDPSMMGGPPPPGMAPTASIAAAVARFSADNIAPKCPKCGSHSTGMVSAEGQCRCHACNNVWDGGTIKTAEERPVLPEDHATMDAGLSQPDDAHPDDHGDPTSTTWSTPDGDPLEAGRQYELHSENYSIPDVVKVEEVKPTELVVTIQGEYNDLEDQVTISREEMDQQGLSFVPVETGDKPAEDTPEYLDGIADADRANTVPTPAAREPFTSREAATPLYPYDGPQPYNDERGSAYQQAHQEAERIYKEHGWGPASAFLGEKLKSLHEEHYAPHSTPGLPQTDLSHVDVAQFGQHMRDNVGGDAPGMWHEKNNLFNPGEEAQPHDHSLEWEPGVKGRGLIADGKLYTWPVNPTPENPQGGLMHGEKMQQLGAKNFEAGFEIDHDGSMVDLGTPLSDDHMALVNHLEPRIQRGESAGFSAFGSADDKPLEGAEWLLEGSSSSSNELDCIDLPNHKEAGAKFSPSEQKRFIDEDGEARNLDKLDLADTHYKIRDTTAHVVGKGPRFADPDAVRADDFALGF